jgi:hypothetical protein
MSPIRAIIGPGRSGTTWAGSIINSCPDVIYRFEPFHRMAVRHPEFRDWFERFKNQKVGESDLPRLYELLRVADPLVDKAPFFSGKSYPVRQQGREQLWPLARLIPPAGWLYRRMYTPPAGPPVVFKEVTFIKPIRNLIERTSVPVVYLVRHPCATVLSEIRGQGHERNPARQRRLRELLLEHAPEYVELFPDVVAGSDVASRTALLWRCEVEACANVIRSSARGMLLTYEQLAADAYRQSERMFGHLGLEFGDATRRYLDELHGERTAASKGRRRTGWGRKYFSVYRNPKEEKDSWKRRITVDEQRKIEAIVRGSPAIEHLASLGGWW